MASSERDGCNGAFIVPVAAYKKAFSHYLQIIATDGEGWEHVSVVVLTKKQALVPRTPNWYEMVMAKRLFWEPDDVVVQFHPAEKDYVNNHPHCLHLWRRKGTNYKTPPTELVGIK